MKGLDKLLGQQTTKDVAAKFGRHNRFTRFVYESGKALSIKWWYVKNAAKEIKYKTLGITELASACKCNECGSVQIYHRFGCECWDSIDGKSMTYGYLTRGGFKSGFNDFISAKELVINIKKGKRYVMNDKEIATDDLNGSN